MGFLSFSLLTTTCCLFFSSAPATSFCAAGDAAALLRFKQSFFINPTTCGTSSGAPRPKVLSWREGEDCCSWDGVDCDGATGRVVGLDVAASCLHGSIDGASSLFSLLHLRRLNLAGNDFDGSQIPTSLGLLPGLTHLDLSSASFSGEIPAQFSELSRLVSLRLQGNPSTYLAGPTLRSLVRNLTRLQELHLSNVTISSPIPDTLASLDSLKSLLLEDCELHGELPHEIFHLPNLRSLSVRYNPNLRGSLPEFRKGSALQDLRVGCSGFSGELPGSISDLASLTWLDLGRCNFSGSIPDSITNLTQLTYLDLSGNHFRLQPSPFQWLAKLHRLTHLDISWGSLEGDIPSSLQNLTRLESLSLRSNQLTGRIPCWLADLSRLTFLDLSQNNLHGAIDDSIFRLSNLRRIYLSHNRLTGAVELLKFGNLSRLTHLSLSHNGLRVLTNTSRNTSFPKMRVLGLGSCNLLNLPAFLRHQDELEWLNLANNHIVSLDPGLNSSTPVFLPWKHLQVLVLIGNGMQGALPIPPPSTHVYDVGNNSFTGPLPPQLCGLTSLYVLDVSNNGLSGAIPSCLGSFSANLAWLNLKGNSFDGRIPETFDGGSRLRDINFSQNRLQGPLPRSLANCGMLEILDISDNRIADRFPHWLGMLPSLAILVLRSNGFHGTVVGSADDASSFPKLRIVDLSHNWFSGKLPPEYFRRNWNAMKLLDRRNSSYMVTSFNIHLVGFGYGMLYSTVLTIKGVETSYSKILDAFTFIDISCNRFSGAIPKSIADLKGLRLLNLSNNHFTGPIPAALGSLMELESLDVSRNGFSGLIPPQLTQLIFLEIFNVSQNDISGPIPRGRQFETFSNASYLGNLRLCGYPLSRQCEEASSPAPATPGSLEMETETGEAAMEIDWVVASIGYWSGLVVGIAMGRALTAAKHE